MNLQDLLTSFFIRPIHQHLAIKTPGAQQGSIQNFRAIGCCQQHYSTGRVKSIQLCQQLIQCLFFLIVTTQSTGTTRAPQRIQLINKNNGRSHLACLFKQITYPGGPHSHEHFNKFRTGNREKRHSGFTRYRPRQQGFTGSRRPDQQNTLGSSSAQPAVFLWILEKINNLDQFFLGFVHTGNIGKGDFCFFFNINLGPALANRHQAAAHDSLVHSPDDKQPDTDKNCHGNNPGKNVAQPGALHYTGISDVVLVQHFRQIRFNPGGNKFGKFFVSRILELTENLLVSNGHFSHFVFLQQRLEAAVGNRLDFGILRIKILDKKNAQYRNQYIPEVDLRFFIRW